MAMKKPTVDEVITAMRAFAKAVTKYGKGMQCCVLNSTNLNSKAKQSKLSKWYNEDKSRQDPKKTNKEYLAQFTSKGYYGADCCGLIKGVVNWGYRVGGPNSGGYVAAQDLTIKAMADSCTDVVPFDKAEPGYFAWTADYGHCCLVTSKGGETFLESAPSCDGVKENKKSYRPDGYFVKAGKYPYIDYTKKEETKPASSSSTTTPTTFGIGEFIKIKSGAKYGGSAKGVEVPDKHENVLYTVASFRTVNAEKCVLVKEINSWVPAIYVTKPAPLYTKQIFNCTNLNVRKTPGGAIVTSLKVGTKVPVYGTSGDWSQIAPNQWISSKYLK